MNLTLPALCARLELAQSRQNRAFAGAWARLHPGARSLDLPAGIGVFLEPGHPFNQALAMGLRGPVDAGELDRLEALLGQGGHPVVLEASAGADPSLFALLAARGYRVRAFQQVHVRALAEPGPRASFDPALEVRPVAPSQVETWARVVGAGFAESDDLAAADASFGLGTAGAEGNELFLAWLGREPAAAGVLAAFDGVAVLSGTATRPRFRGRGAQRALVAARLERARALGCALACSATLAGGASQANLEKCGFTTAYPKLELVRER